MNDTDVLQHLLEIEAQASVLVDDAQAEADRRLKSAEEQNRSFYEGQYQNLIGELEEEYHKQLEVFKSGYTKSLDEYRCSLDSMPVNTGAFSSLAFSLLFGEK
jgi:vacuolar-type H+-ATPase subunit H